MKLAYILNTYPQRSHSFIRREIHALERRGAQVLRLAMRPSADKLVEPLDLAELQRCEHVLRAGVAALISAVSGQFLRRPAAAFGALKQAFAMGRGGQAGVMRHLIYLAEACYVARRCKAETIDHMHAHFGTNATTVALLAHQLSGIPYSFTVHGPEEFDQVQPLNLPSKIENAAFTVAISQFGRSQLCRWVDARHWDRIKVVHCGIEPQAFPDPQPLSNGPARLVCIGRFAEQKGHVTLIRAVAKLRDRLPELHLVLVGDGEMRATIEHEIESARISDMITLAGWLGEAEVRRELDAAHAMVLPSFAEGLPMVVMEAMAAARPVIATYIAGTPELVQPGKSGWLVPAGDEDALADAIAELAQTDPSELQAMGTAGRERVMQRHDVDALAEQLTAHFANAGA